MQVAAETRYGTASDSPLLPWMITLLYRGRLLAFRPEGNMKLILAVLVWPGWTVNLPLGNDTDRTAAYGAVKTWAYNGTIGVPAGSEPSGTNVLTVPLASREKL